MDDRFGGSRMLVSQTEDSGTVPGGLRSTPASLGRFPEAPYGGCPPLTGGVPSGRTGTFGPINHYYFPVNPGIVPIEKAGPRPYSMSRQ